MKLVPILLILAAAMLGIASACKVARSPESTAMSDAAAVCSVEAIESLVATQGVIDGLASDGAACLDDGAGDTSVVAGSTGDGSRRGDDEAAGSEAAARAEPATGAGAFGAEGDTRGDQGTPVEGTGAASLALTDGATHRLQLEILIGWRIMNDLLNEVGTSAVEGRGRGGRADANQLRAEVREGLDAIRPILVELGTRAEGRVVYSYSDLYALVKSRFVDPQVYGYRGPFHRIIHRRYARGRGIVYGIVSRKLAEALGQFDAMARVELAALSDATIRLSLARVHGSLGTAEASFLTLSWDGKVVGRPVSYREARQLADVARRELPRLLASPAVAGAASGLGGLTSAAGAGSSGCECRYEGGACGLYKGGKRLWNIPGVEACQTAAVDHCATLRRAAGAVCGG